MMSNQEAWKSYLAHRRGVRNSLAAEAAIELERKCMPLIEVEVINTLPSTMSMGEAEAA